MLTPPGRATSLALAIAGGAATALAFPDVGWWPTAFLGIALLVLALGRDSARWNALVAAVYGLTFFLPHIWWAHEATAVVPWLALGTLQASYLATLGAGVTWARRAPWLRDRRWAQVVVFAVLWVAVEQWRSIWPFGGFPWGKLAFSQADSPLVGAAWLGGAPLVSFLVAVVGGILAVVTLAVLARSTRVAPLLVGLGVAGALVVAPLLVPLDTEAQSGTLEVGAVQGNVGDPGLGAFANRGEVLQNHVDGTYALLDEVDPGDLDVVLWPENGSDLDPQTALDVADDIDAAAQSVDAPILVGAQEFPADGGRYNVALLWEPGVGVVDRYAKQHPAAFGEYIPMRGFVRLFTDQVDRVTNDMIAGTEVGIIDLDVPRLDRTVPLATLICFEVAYDGLIQDAVRAGERCSSSPPTTRPSGSLRSRRNSSRCRACAPSRPAGRPCRSPPSGSAGSSHRTARCSRRPSCSRPTSSSRSSRCAPASRRRSSPAAGSSAHSGPRRSSSSRSAWSQAAGAGR
ncbi:hypothetical protein GCM10025865_29260 [Paraoerskovia sediminicola]|uniref:CN hydrolase domain-containing protein n=1 Tax=Paraoerskovia sediminicola TaxID=1138587 RepID=A0ABN6XFD9_9CELL|nr:hypothetical protein GCM10025865_29260 [Paraoerskovia sediminicola]